MLITFMGARGVGKTTQCKLIEKHLMSKNKKVAIVKALDDHMKDIFSNQIINNSDMVNNFLFCMFYRRQTELIKEHLSQGSFVIADRFIEHFYFHHKYSGFIKSHGVEIYNTIRDLVFEQIAPDLTIYLKADFVTASERFQKRSYLNTRKELVIETKETFQVYDNFCKKYLIGKNNLVIDATKDPHQIFEIIINKLNL